MIAKNQEKYYWGELIKRSSNHTGIPPKKLHEALMNRFAGEEVDCGLWVSKEIDDMKMREFNGYLAVVIRWMREELGLEVELMYD